MSIFGFQLFTSWNETRPNPQPESRREMVEADIRCYELYDMRARIGGGMTGRSLDDGLDARERGLRLG